MARFRSPRFLSPSLDFATYSSAICLRVIVMTPPYGDAFLVWNVFQTAPGQLASTDQASIIACAGQRFPKVIEYIGGVVQDVAGLGPRVGDVRRTACAQGSLDFFTG